jgi:hypothetical protein
MALRPWRRASSISSRYGSQALAVGARLGSGGPVDRPPRIGKPAPKSVDTSLAGFAGSVDTAMAGFAGGRRRRGARIAMPAAFR